MKKLMIVVAVVGATGCSFVKSLTKDDGVDVGRTKSGGCYAKEIAHRGHRYLIADGCIIHEESCKRQDDAQERLAAATAQQLQRR